MMTAPKGLLERYQLGQLASAPEHFPGDQSTHKLVRDRVLIRLTTAIFG